MKGAAFHPKLLPAASEVQPIKGAAFRPFLICSPHPQFRKTTDHFPIHICAIFRKFQEIKELRGGVLLYAAQGILQTCHLFGVIDCVFRRIVTPKLLNGSFIGSPNKNSRCGLNSQIMPRVQGESNFFKKPTGPTGSTDSTALPFVSRILHL